MASFDFNLECSLIEGSNTQIFPPTDFTDANVAKNTVKDINIAALATDAEISLDGLTVKHLRAVFSATVSLKINGSGNTAITLTPTASSPAMLCLVGGNVTSLFVTNPGAAAVECKLIAMAE